MISRRDQPRAVAAVCDRRCHEEKANSALTERRYSLTVCGTAGPYRRRELVPRAVPREDHKRAPCKDYNKNQAFRPNAHTDNRPEAADHNVQLDPAVWLRRLTRRPRLLQLRQSTQREHYRSPRRR